MPAAIAETGSCSVCSSRALVFPCSGCCMDGGGVRCCSRCIGQGQLLGHRFPLAGAGGCHSGAEAQGGVAQAPAQDTSVCPPEREVRDVCVIQRQPLAVVVCRDAAHSLGKRWRDGAMGGQGHVGPLCSPQKRVRLEGSSM